MAPPKSSSGTKTAKPAALAVAPAKEAIPDDIKAAREALKAKMGDAQTGGKGSMRRKTAPVTRSSQLDDKSLGDMMRKAGLPELQPLDEANIIMKDDSVLQVKMPRSWALLPANTMVINGTTSNVPLQRLAPDMQAGAKSLAARAAAMGLTLPTDSTGTGAATSAPAGTATAADDDDMPALTGDFEQAEDQD